MVAFGAADCGGAAWTSATAAAIAGMRGMPAQGAGCVTIKALRGSTAAVLASILTWMGSSGLSRRGYSGLGERSLLSKIS